jgi:predicted N-acyltransferase
MTATTAKMRFDDRSSFVPLLEANQRKKIKDRRETAKAAQLKILMTK